MNSFRKLLSFVAILAIGFAFVQCDGGEEEPEPPSPPTITSDVSTLSVKLAETKSFNVAVSAAGMFKELKVTSDKGTVTATDIVGVGQATASAKITFVAPLEVSTGKITITVTDNASNTVTKDVALDIAAESPLEVAAGNVEGVWGPARTILVHGDLTIAADKSLTIKEGTTVIFDAGTGIVVEGNFYSMGTAEHPNKFTVPTADQKKENIFKGLWGGILGTTNSKEMVVLYSSFEYAGAPAKANTPIVTSGELKEGDPRFTLYFNNPTGKFIMQNSSIAYTKDDGMRINQGQLLINNNTYMLNGESGGEALNIKSGSVGDVSYNLFISAATNGVKWSNSDDRTPQNNVNVYNNTAINCGWRQTKAGRGGSFNLEKGGRGKAYNNMAVNCKYGTRFPKAADAPDLANSVTGYNLYYGNNDESVAGFYPSTGSLVSDDAMAAHNVVGLKGENDPKFVNWDVTKFDLAVAKTSANIDFLAAFDFKLQTGSPALTKGFTGFERNFTDHTVGGVKYTVPTPSNYIGAKSN